ncbi:hypothetical protein [Streptomyces olivoreticuli]|uniref:hypothetical protein n=1 Tax=Streptomyces olivoreticuli TaxID=68246 RepID=UPI0013C30E20|nr:hypothetical protein [Streptomyces olivoreticuli]
MSTGSHEALPSAALLNPLSLPDDSRIPGAPTSGGVADYERYFHISRDAPDLATWTRGCLDLQAAVLDDLPRAGLEEEQRVGIVTGLLLASHATLMSWTRTAPGPGETPPGTVTEQPSAPSTVASAGDQAGALRRWKLGHQLFHLLLTVMNTTLDETVAAARDSQWPSLVSGMERLEALYEAATAAMTYASDFPSSVYRNEIRPTMEPPFVAPGFSGVFNREHQVMADRLHTLGRALENLSPETGAIDAIRRAEASLRAAQRRNRRNHVRICERCVPEGGSLRRQHLVREEGRNTST